MLLTNALLFLVIVLIILSAYLHLLNLDTIRQHKISHSFDRHEDILTYITFNAVSSTLKSKVAILICSKSQRWWRNVSDTNLYTTLIPSLKRTINPQEVQQYSIEVYIAHDSTDLFFIKSVNREAIATICNFTVTFISVEKRVRNKIPFNAIARVAHDLGSDFFVRINDDSEFITSAWISKGVMALKGLNPNFLGVVGPYCPDGNTKILTHDMVHRTHLDIFGEYYPDIFDNFFVDDWISSVYGTNRTVRIASWVVRHHIKRHGTRYKVRKRKFFYLNSSITQGREKINSYLSLRHEQQTT
jgi:hypothetical protein